MLRESCANSVYVLVLSGSNEVANIFAKRRYPNYDVISLSKRELREGGWKKQVNELRNLKGEAFLVFVDSIANAQEPLLLKLTIWLHRCRQTVIADSYGTTRVLSRHDRWRLLPEAVLSVLADAFVFLAAWVWLNVLRVSLKKPGRPSTSGTCLDVAFLYPFPMDRSETGGAMSHVKGFLSGLAKHSAECEIFSGRPFPFDSFPIHEIPQTRRFYAFREAVALFYNWRFAKQVIRRLRKSPPRFLYQRHGRYVFAGALLSKWLRRPLVLEYNGSEVWIGKYWDPSHFAGWLKLCEEVSLAAASLIVVVSEPLKTELVGRGYPAHKILVNPNAVDPSIFRPGCGGEDIRRQFGFQPNHIVVAFIGSFSYWHGISVLQSAIETLLQEQQNDGATIQLRFLLLGDGPLRVEMRDALARYCDEGWVNFTGQVSHDRAAAYLDSADILVSPHVPMPDRTPFFGSPTKMFEYMAVGKAIIASNLDQLARVLTHQQTAMLVTPGSASELAAAIGMLATRPDLRIALGRNAREAALSRHTWQENAGRVLAALAGREPVPTKDLSQSLAG